MLTGADAEVVIGLLLDNNGGGGRGGVDNQLTETADGVGIERMEKRSNMMGTQEFHYMNLLII